MKYTLAVLVAALALVGAGCTTQTGQEAATNASTQQAVTTNSNTSESVASIEEALGIALQDEYKARATYQQVIATYGEVTPFTNIVQAEQKHIDSLLGLYDSYGYEVPQNEYADADLLEGIASVQEACAAGVQAEIDNAALYRDQLLRAAEGYSNVTTVFNNLMDASQNNHLPAFERCAS